MGGEQSGARVQVNKKSAHKEELLDFVEARPRGVELAGLGAKDALDGARRRPAHVAARRRGRSAEHGGQASERLVLDVKRLLQQRSLKVDGVALRAPCDEIGAPCWAACPKASAAYFASRRGQNLGCQDGAPA